MVTTTWVIRPLWVTLPATSNTYCLIQVYVASTLDGGTDTTNPTISKTLDKTLSRQKLRIVLETSYVRFV